MFRRFGSGLLLLSAFLILGALTLRQPAQLARPDAVPNRFEHAEHHYIITDCPRLNIALATREELIELPKIGETLANRILAHRDAIGGFTSIDQLLEVEGLGAATFAAIEPYIAVK